MLFFTAQTVKQSEKLQIFTSTLIPVLGFGFVFFLPKIFMILLGHVMRYTGSGWHQEIFLFFDRSLLSIALSFSVG